MPHGPEDSHRANTKAARIAFRETRRTLPQTNGISRNRAGNRPSQQLLSSLNWWRMRNPG
jgi:hypothetical protein